MQRYDTVFFDADNTLFDFDAAERAALMRILPAFSVPATAENLAFYIQCNASLWASFDRGEISREALTVTRFARLLERAGKSPAPAAELNAAYLTALGEEAILLSGAEALCRHLSAHCRLYILTNGMHTAQTGRLERAPIRDTITEMFVSQDMGCQKPQAEFFQKVFSAIGLTPAQQARTVMVGDNLLTDILGGQNAGLDTIWYNRAGAENSTGIHPTWEVGDFDSLSRIILNP